VIAKSVSKILFEERILKIENKKQTNKDKTLLY
jgi:hypothetical protein